MVRNRLLFIAFCMAHSGKNLLWSGVDGLSLYILIKVVGVSPIAAGALFVLSSFWNAAMDGAWGYMLGRSAMIRPILPALCAACVIVACLSFALLPSLPVGSGVAAAVALILFRTSFALFDVPHNATTALLAKEHGHLALARWRSILSAMMSILIAAAAAMLVGVDAATSRAIFVFPALALVALILLSPLPWLIGAMEGDAGIGEQDAVRRSAGIPPRPLVMFCLIQMMGFAALASIGKSMLHIDALPPWVLEHALLLLSVVRLLGTWLWAPIATRLGSAIALCLAYLACAGAILLLPAAISLGPVWSVAVLCLLGASFGGVALLAWSAFSELLSRVAGNVANLSASYGLFTAISKIGLGFSGFLTAAWVGLQDHGLTTQSLWPMVILVAGLCVMTAFLGWPGWRWGFWSRRTPILVSAN
ncbi:MFS transporter [Sphingobium sp. AP49]|uniref:MFS transporter n=1 Tax=Sphingobium sp. AP49 TaxID=1144307 RepID=UPI00031269B6|nr:MFS transporter [Sphingobium sp. AP49]WHO37649.1 MFS transporter [Sphingobium sp. AP49]